MFPCGLFYSTRQQRSVNSLIRGKKAIHVPVLDLIQHLTIRQYTCCVCKSKLWRHCQTEGYIINHHFPFKMGFLFFFSWKKKGFPFFLLGIFTRFCRKIKQNTLKLRGFDITVSQFVFRSISNSSLGSKLWWYKLTIWHKRALSN